MSTAAVIDAGHRLRGPAALLSVNREVASLLEWTGCPAEEDLRIMLMIAALATTVASTGPARFAPVNAAGWLVAARGEGCAAGMEFTGPGNSYLLIHKSVDGEVYLAITNDAWSAQADKSYKVSYQLNGKDYADGNTTGYRNGAARGFWSIMGAGFEQDFAAGKDLSVFLDGRFIRKLSLAGSGAAMAAVNRCVTELRSRPAGKRRKAPGVPKDPFADPGPTPPARRAPKSRP